MLFSPRPLHTSLYHQLVKSLQPSLWHAGQDGEQGAPVRHSDKEVCCHSPPQRSPGLPAAREALCSGTPGTGCGALSPPAVTGWAAAATSLCLRSMLTQPLTCFSSSSCPISFLVSKWACVSSFWVSFALSVSLYVYLLCSLSCLTSLLFLVTLSVSFSFSLSSPFLKPPEVRSLRGSQNASIQYRDPEVAANFLGI